MISFADSTRPALIPSAFTHVLAYMDGRYAWSPAQLARFPAHVMISVTGDPAAAEFAREQDSERFDATPQQFPPFALNRINLGHDDPTCYTSILGDPGYGLAQVLLALENAGMAAAPWRLHVAWWWQRPFPPAAFEVLAEIKALTGIDLPPRRLWACQWQNGTSYDSSILYGRDDFTR